MSCSIMQIIYVYYAKIWKRCDDAGMERKEIYCAFRYGSFVSGYVYVTYVYI